MRLFVVYLFLIWNLSLFEYSSIFLIFEEREIFHIKNGGQTHKQTDRVTYRVASQLKITFGSEWSFLNSSRDIHKTKGRTGLHPHSSSTYPSSLGLFRECHVWSFFCWVTINIWSILLSCEMLSSCFIIEIVLILSFFVRSTENMFFSPRIFYTAFLCEMIGAKTTCSHTKHQRLMQKSVFRDSPPNTRSRCNSTSTPLKSRVNYFI